jgi:hypothetical protein
MCGRFLKRKFFSMVNALILALVLILQSASAADLARAAGGVDLRFDRVSLYQASRVVYADVLGENFVMDESVVTSDSLIAVDLRGLEAAQLRVVFDAVMASYGVSVSRLDGVTRLVRGEKLEPELEFLVYRPLFRSVGYLTQSLAGFARGGRFGGVVSGARGPSFAVGVAPQGGGAASVPGAAGVPNVSASGGGAGAAQVVPGEGAVSGSPDVLVFSGSRRDVDRIRVLIPSFDVVAREVSVVATVFEVDVRGSDSSGVSLAFSLLGGRLGGAVSGAGAGVPLLSLSSAAFSAALSVLASDSRFRQLSNATLRVKSGEVARMSVGSDVPILTESSVTGTGIATQSVTYRSAGIGLELRALVLEKVVELQVTQDLSSAVVTVSGVNGTPTFNRRHVSTVVNGRSGDVIVLGGLTDRQESGQRSGVPFLPRWLGSNSTDRSGSEVVLLLRVQVPAVE